MCDDIKLNTFIVIGGLSWGRAGSVDDAFINWLKIERPRGDCSVHVYQTNADAEVNGMGKLFAAKGTKKLGEVILTRKFLEKWKSIDIDIEAMLTDVTDAIDYTQFAKGEIQT